MQRDDEVLAMAGAGLSGDRYAQHTGYWSGVDECQVTLIEAEALDGITSSTEVRVTEGQHRRNVVVRGVEPRAPAAVPLHRVDHAAGHDPGPGRPPGRDLREGGRVRCDPGGRRARGRGRLP